MPSYPSPFIALLATFASMAGTTHHILEKGHKCLQGYFWQMRKSVGRKRILHPFLTNNPINSSFIYSRLHCKPNNVIKDKKLRPLHFMHYFTLAPSIFILHHERVYMKECTVYSIVFGSYILVVTPWKYGLWYNSHFYLSLKRIKIHKV